MNNLCKKIVVIIALFVVAVFSVIMINEIMLCRYYNSGNELFEEENYEEAKLKYEKALDCFPNEKRECQIRINIALCMVKPIDVRKIDDSNINKVIDTLENAKKVLLEEGCANDEGTGHSKDAQQLKDEIDKFIDQLKKSGQSSDSNNKKDKEEQKDEQSKEEEELEKQLKELQKQGAKEREQEQKIWDNSSDLDSLWGYDGDCW